MYEPNIETEVSKTEGKGWRGASKLWLGKPLKIQEVCSVEDEIEVETKELACR